MLYRLLRFFIKYLCLCILPIILSIAAYFIGPPHSFYIKGLMGMVIGFAIQHRQIVKALDEMIEEIDRHIFEDDFDQ